MVVDVWPREQLAEPVVGTARHALELALQPRNRVAQHLRDESRSIGDAAGPRRTAACRRALSGWAACLLRVRNAARSLDSQPSEVRAVRRGRQDGACSRAWHRHVGKVRAGPFQQHRLR